MTTTAPKLRDRGLRLMAVGEATPDGAEWEVLRVGPVVDPDGTLVVDITAKLAQAFADGVTAMVAAGLDIPIDFSHESERPGADGSHATLGVVTGARFDAASGRVYATKRLNALGRARLAADVGDDGNGVSLRTSPTLRMRDLSHPSEPGKVIATAWMSSLAVTDRPRQNGLAAISLSAGGPVDALLARYEGADGSERAHREALASACIAALHARGLAPGDDGWMGLADWNTEAAIVEVYREGEDCALYRIPYTDTDDIITTGAPEAVERRVTYQPKPAATVAVEMSRPAGAHNGGTLMAEQAQSTQTPEAAAPAPDKVTLAQVREERDVLRLARDKAQAEADALKVELAKVRSAAEADAALKVQLSQRIEALEAANAERAEKALLAEFEQHWKTQMKGAQVVAGAKEANLSLYRHDPAAWLLAQGARPAGAVGITLGAPAGSPGEAADAPKDDAPKVNVVQLCQERAAANGTDFETEYKRLRAERLQREVA